MIATPESVLEFWFGDDLDSPEATAALRALWFGGDPSFDERIRQRFDDLPTRALRGDLDTWRQTARPNLALVLVLDQFPRNLYRGTARAFAYDSPARAVAVAAIESRFDAALAPLEATFLYLPLEHSEDIPHRNAILGRTSTSEELSYLESGGDTFDGAKGPA